MRKNGFTLIELLAVIVILAIIALIATPIILGIINDAREKANERSVELYASAVRNAIASYQLINPTAPKSFSDLTIQYDGEVKCTVQELYADGNFYLEGCKVNNVDKEYSYGTKQESDVVKVCTRQNDEDGYDTVTCTIGENTESFYVMNSYLTDVPSDKIVMMTKYNIDPATKRQSEIAGNIAFSSTNYWSNGEIDVFDERNDITKSIVNEYVSYLNGTLIETATGSLLTYSHAENLGCSGSGGSCSSAPSWVYSTNYWTGSAYVSIGVWYVSSGGNFGYAGYGVGNSYGVRPVITISTTEIK